MNRQFTLKEQRNCYDHIHIVNPSRGESQREGTPKNQILKEARESARVGPPEFFAVVLVNEQVRIRCLFA